LGTSRRELRGRHSPASSYGQSGVDATAPLGSNVVQFAYPVGGFVADVNSELDSCWYNDVHLSRR
jgi:hypothetical protein